MTGAFLLPAGTCDTHLHFYDGSFPTAPAAVLRPPDATVADYRELQAPLGMDRLVVVQPTTYGLDNRCQIEAMAAFGDAAREVMVVDGGTRLSELARLTDLGVRGARFHMLPGGAVGWDTLDGTAARVAAFGWHIQLQMNGLELGDRVDRLRRLPVDLVVDHVGRFMPPSGIEHPGFEALLSLVDDGNTWVKLSAHYESSPDPDAVLPLIDELVRRYPDRMLWRPIGPTRVNRLRRGQPTWRSCVIAGCPRRICADGSWSTILWSVTTSDPDGHTMTDPAGTPSTDYATYPSLLDRKVFITGGADGIGAAMVEQFARQGSRVGFADINVEKATETVARCVASGSRHDPQFYEVDLVDVAALREVMTRALDDLGGITVLVNNAASDDRHTWEEVTADYWDDRINTNLRHYFFAIQAVAPQMIEAKSGSIINIGSSSYMMQEDFFPGYAIAKSAVEGITRTMARTFGGDNVRVNTVLPGWVATERQLTKWWSPEGEEGTLRDQAIKRRIYPAEFAQMVLFLAADDGAACTAQQFLVDGGRR